MFQRASPLEKVFLILQGESQRWEVEKWRNSAWTYFFLHSKWLYCIGLEWHDLNFEREDPLISLVLLIQAVLYYRSWWDWSGIGVGWVPTWPSQTPTIHPWQFFWLIIVSVPKINAISFNIKTSMVGLGGMEWDWVGWMRDSVFFCCKIWYSRKCSFGPYFESVSAWV